MHPDPEREQSGLPTGRIVYIGDVRRRREARRRAPDRHYLFALGLIALVAWAAWLAVLVSLAPSRLLSYLAFFTPLTIALSASGAIVSYVVEGRVTGWPVLRRSTRHGLLLAAVIVANLALLAAHRWILPVASVTVVGAVLVEIAI